ncbi:MAG: 50S ribosomal protein L11 methyltransferase [Firmicutes bacterium]|nr:50S ribosomal protein L11 methyltransferase [Bacillota bacterium]
MNWLEVFVSTSKEGLEIVSGLFYSMGIQGLLIEDSDDFAEFLNDPNREWDYIDDDLTKDKLEHERGITFYVRENSHGIEQLNGIRGGLISLKESEKEFDLGSLEVTVKNIAEDDWANNWKKYYKPFPIGEKILIRPSWEELDDDGGRIVLTIDPGHVFGTGSHETTRLCVETLQERLEEGDRVLDIGSGSGILSIASLLLGAKEADAIDIDPNAVDTAYSNAAMNGIGKDTYHVISGNVLGDEAIHNGYKGQGYDVVVANIVADIIVALCDLVPEYIKVGGTFITSGIIVPRLEDVKEAMAGHGFEVVDVKTDKDWAMVCAVYRG